ncbi:MAG: RelB [Lentilactobacillus diolivorans]
MSKTKQKIDRISVRVAPEVKLAAKERLAKVGLNLSDYIQMALANLAAGANDFLNSPSALAAKYQAENGEVETIGDGSATDFEKYLNKLEN